MIVRFEMHSPYGCRKHPSFSLCGEIKKSVYDMNNILARLEMGGDTMPFWTLFWVIVPPVVLIAAAIVFYVQAGKDKEA